MHGLGDAVNGVEHAVDAHPDHRVRAPGLDVDVARSLLVCIDEEKLGRRAGSPRARRQVIRAVAKVAAGERSQALWPTS